ncbi:MAG: metallophosphoesterase [Marinilabiliales bacterium]|nr:MAG: metallophosphoesterase [Marinilabiliales bacterium]
MRTIAFIIFYSIVLSVYLLVNYYIFIRGWQALPAASRVRNIYLALFLFLSLAYVAGRILENYWLSPPTNFLLWTGSFWLGAMVYFVLILAAIDLIRLVNLAVPVIPSGWLANAAGTKLVLFYGVTATVFVIIMAAHVNTWFIKVNEIDITLSGKRTALAYHAAPAEIEATAGSGIPGETGEAVAEGGDPAPGDNHGRMENVTIALISDIHLGSLTPKNRIKRMVDRVNSLNPDIILLAGDILDEDVGPVIHRDLGRAIENLSAPLGVYGITGNHEYIGGVAEAAKYLTSHGINLIRDSVIKINNSFYLAGREDITINRFSGRNRKSVEELLDGVNDNLPVILMDHQPFNLEKAAAAGADLFLAGHTHHGQLWPFNLITNAIYTISRGKGEVDGMKVYVSNGIGTWGPPMRLGSRPEIVLIRASLNNL